MELLVVMGILGLLAGLGASGLQGIRNWIARQESLSLFMELESACRMYRMDHGSWPESLGPGEIDLNASDSGWRDDLGPYMERPVHGHILKDGFGNTGIFMVIDDDGDHWIEGGSLESVEPSLLPERIWARVALYSVDPEGNLKVVSWEDESE